MLNQDEGADGVTRLSNGDWSDRVHQAFVLYLETGGPLPFFAWHQTLAPAHRLCSLCDVPGETIRTV